MRFLIPAIAAAAVLNGAYKKPGALFGHMTGGLFQR